MPESTNTLDTLIQRHVAIVQHPIPFDDHFVRKDILLVRLAVTRGFVDVHESSYDALFAGSVEYFRP